MLDVLADLSCPRDSGDHDSAVTLIARAVDTGLHCPQALESSPLLAPVRSHPVFVAALTRARIAHQQAARAFAAAGGHRLLGITPASTGAQL